MARGTYSGNPATAALDRVRWLAGDNDGGPTDEDYLVTDGEIAAALSANGANAYRAAAEVCDNLARRFARDASKTVSNGVGGSVSEDLSRRSDVYRQLAIDLREQAATTGATGPSVPMPFAGGISRSRKAVVESNSDRVVPAFAIADSPYDPERLP